MSRNRLFNFAILAAAVTVLSACGGSESAESSSTVAAQASETTAATSAPSTTNAPTTTTTTTTTTTSTAAASQETQVSTTTVQAEEPAEVDPTCDWDSPRLASGDTSEPTGEGDDLALTILGSWQHTHINEGGGFKPVMPTTDIRYVLSSDTFLYCQDVQGATKQAENSAPLVLEGDELVLPSPATGYKVVAWNENMMVWLNHRDDSLYLLQRR